MITSLFRQITSIRSRLKSNNFMPLIMSINITGRCNLRCKFCEKSESKSSNEISFDGMVNLLSYARSNKIDVFFGINCARFPIKEAFDGYIKLASD